MCAYGRDKQVLTGRQVHIDEEIKDKVNFWEGP